MPIRSREAEAIDDGTEPNEYVTFAEENRDCTKEKTVETRNDRHHADECSEIDKRERIESIEVKCHEEGRR